MPIFRQTCEISTPAATAFAWHEQPGVFQRLTPPWEPVEVVRQTGGLQDGAQVELRIKAGPVPIRWIAEHYGYMTNQQFCDRQVQGPFSRWEHIHRFEPLSANRCRLTDHVEYELPLSPISHLPGRFFVEQKLKRLFAYRHHVTRHDVSLFHQYKDRKPMKILISGASGLIGSHLMPLLTSQGHQVIRLVRTKPAANADDVWWDQRHQRIDTEAMQGVDAVIHLAGESIVGARWTQAKKNRIYHSRIDGTKLLSQALASMENPPKTFICASAIGYYGDRGETVLTEDSESGSGFLADVCRDWEAATQPAIDKGLRVVNVRIGVVLTPEGGALKMMLLPFKMGVGGVVSSGEQFMSWITLDDLIGAIYHCLMTESLSGPVNLTGPNPATNREFTKTLGRVLSRPTPFPVPGFAAKLALGEMADEMALASIRVLPQKLLQTGYAFRHPDLEPALRHILGR